MSICIFIFFFRQDPFAGTLSLFLKVPEQMKRIESNPTIPDWENIQKL